MNLDLDLIRLVHGAMRKVPGAPVPSMMAGLGRTRQVQGTRCKAPCLSRLDQTTLDLDCVWTTN